MSKKHSAIGIPMNPDLNPADASHDHVEHDQTDKCPACHAIVNRLTSELESLHRSELCIGDRVAYAIDLAATVVMLSSRPDRIVEASAAATKEFIDRLAKIGDGLGLLRPALDAFKANGGDQMIKDMIAAFKKSPDGFTSSSTGDAELSADSELESAINRLARMPPANKKPC